MNKQTNKQIFVLFIILFFSTNLLSFFSGKTDEVVATSNEERAWSYLRARGYTEAATAGVIGNFYVESGMEPTKKQYNGGPGRGLAQWGYNADGGRFNSLIKWARSIGADEWNLETQLEWTVKEMTAYGMNSKMKSTTNIADATEYFGRVFEAPACLKCSIQLRISNAQGVYARRVGSIPPVDIKNYAYMDSFTYTNGFINANGWAFNKDLQPTYATDRVANSYVAFLMDAATGVELARTGNGFYYRNDVAQVFNRYRNVGYGGFKLSFPMQPGWEGKRVFIMIRFANDAAGNIARVEDNYQLRGNVLNLPTTDGTLDIFTATDAGIHARGWHASPIGGEYRYLLVMDATTNRELGRTKISNVSRPDISNVHPAYPQAAVSGFDAVIPLQVDWRGKTVYIMSRYTNDAAGNFMVSDKIFSSNKIVLPGQKMVGSLDEFKQVNEKTLKVRGWNVSTLTNEKQTRYIFVMDATTNIELYRQKITGVNRPDIAQAYPWMPKAMESGFDTTISIPNTWKGKQVYIMSRYSNNASGNDDGKDLYFSAQKLAIV